MSNGQWVQSSEVGAGVLHRPLTASRQGLINLPGQSMTLVALMASRRRVRLGDERPGHSTAVGLPIKVFFQEISIFLR
jgi:hypothetical protein